MRDPNCTPAECAAHPVAGDVWKKGRFERHVTTSTFADVVTYRRWSANGFEKFQRECSLKAWSRWCATAIMIRRGDEDVETVWL